MIETILSEKFDERKILLKRFFWADRDFYRLGKKAKIDWFDTFDKKFSQDDYAYFADEERKEAIELIVSKPNDEVFANVVTSVYNEKERYSDFKLFIGKHYYFDKQLGVKCEDRSKEVVEKTQGALKETNGRASYLLRAIIELYKDGRWDKVWRGAIWEDILEKVRHLGGKYPSPRDLSILKSFKIYVRAGSRRYPVHAVPEEMIPTIEVVLKNFKIKSE